MESFLNNIKEVVGEYKSEIYSIYGEPNVGKTVYLIGEVVNAVDKGVRVIWIDSEGGFMPLFEIWRDRYLARFSGKWDDKKFVYKQVINFKDALQYLGLDVDIDLSKEGKMGIIYKGEVKKKEMQTIYDDIGRAEKSMIILDSFSMLFRGEFGTMVSNFASRSDAMALLYFGLRKAMAKAGSIVITTHHESKSPINPWQQHGELRGGELVWYISKYILYFEKPRKNVLTDYRRVWGVRTPVAKEWGIYRWIKLSENGYFDSNEKEIEAVVNGGEK